MLGLLETEYGFFPVCCRKLSCCSGLVDAWVSEGIFLAGTSATLMISMCFEICAQRNLVPSFVAGGVWICACMPPRQTCDTKVRAHTRLRTLRSASGRALERSLDAAACVRRAYWNIRNVVKVETGGKTMRMWVSKWNWNWVPNLAVIEMCLEMRHLGAP